jgi:hypothetical protein
MEEKKLKRKGSVARTEEGGIALVNEQKQGFIVEEMVVVIWDLCEGRSEHQVVDEIASRIKAEKERIKPAVIGVISKLKELKLVE